MKELKILHKHLLRIYKGESIYLPDKQDLLNIISIVENKDCKHPTRKKRQITKLVSAIDDFINDMARYKGEISTGEYAGDLIYNWSLQEYIQNEINLEYRPNASNRTTFDEYIHEFCEIKKPTNVEMVPIHIPTNLDDICHEGAKDKINSFLQSHNLIDDLSHVWVYNDKGYKKIAAVLMKFFIARKYFKRVVTDTDIKELLETEFKLEIGLRTIRGAKANEKFLDARMRNIPLFCPDEIPK